jgi:proteasome accessory factor B
MSDFQARGSVKWDRAARYLKIARVLHEHPAGISAQQVADLVGVSKRTIYRDLDHMDGDAGIPIWSDGGKYGLESSVFLPPLALTLHEATTLFLAARMLAKTSDEHDTELIGAFVKLAAVLPPVLAEHIRETVDTFASATEHNETFTRVFRVLAQGWAERRVVEIDYDAGVYDPSRGSRRTRVRPLFIEPSALTHALYLMGWDESREARRTFKVERILSATLTPETFEPGDGGTVADLSRAWDVIGDEDPIDVVIRFSPAVAKRAAETRWHPSQVLDQQADGSLLWRGTVAGMREIRIWILGWGADAEVLEPAELRSEIAAELARAASLYS